MHVDAARLADLPDDSLRLSIDGRPLRFHLYAALRREQRAAARLFTSPERREPSVILSFARSACNEIGALLSGRDELDSARDGDWTLRDLLRHAIAVELRYREQVLWSAERGDADPLAIPEARLPCDRLSPPREYAASLTADVAHVLELLGRARSRSDERLSPLPDASLERPSLWGELEIDVRERLHQISAHLVEVVIQTEKMLGTRESEARRIVRRIAALRGMHEDRTPARELAQLDERITALARAL